MNEQTPLSLRGRNPDVLTCIANLSNDEVFTPPEFANRMLDTLAEGWAASNGGANIWADSKVRFLDPCTKSGVFLREITSRLIMGLEDEITDLQSRVDHILTEQVFGIGITQLTGLLARRSLYCSKDALGEHSVASGFESGDGNVWFERTEHDWVGTKCDHCGAPRKEPYDRVKALENYAYPFVHPDGASGWLAEMFGGGMQFDVIIGNPPYQLSGGGGGTNDSPIYHLFVQQAMRLEPRFISMVIPSRWMAGGRGMDDFRATMLSNRHVRHLVDYPNSAQVFPGVDLKSGVCYFVWDRDNEGDCATTLIRDGEIIGPTNRRLDENDVLIRDARAAKILQKVLKHNEPSFEDILTGDTPFGLATNFKDFKTKEPSGDEITVYASSNSGRRTGSIKRSLIKKNTHLIDSWKVLAPQAGPGNSGGHVLPDMVLGKPSIAEPGTVCTQTWIVAGPFESKEQAEIAARYLQTSFLRFLVSLRKISQHAMRGVYHWVPQQDWTQEWTDKKLYQKYGITEEEVAFIDRMIRPMEAGGE